MKRFYKEVAVEQTADGWQVTLDGRPIRTVGGRPQVVSSAKLGRALAAEAHPSCRLYYGIARTR